MQPQSELEDTSASRPGIARSFPHRCRPIRPFNPAANNLVSRFVEAGILAEITGQARNRRFMYQSYIRLFHDDASDAGP